MTASSSLVNTSTTIDGLRWLAVMLKEREPSSGRYREGTSDALAGLVAAALSSDAQALRNMLKRGRRLSK